MVFGVILGTGVGGGIVLDQRLWTGANAIAGEWGHNPLPAIHEQQIPNHPCYCGRTGCIETYLSGPALELDYFRTAGTRIDAREIVALAGRGDHLAAAALKRFYDRLAAALAGVVNILDPDVVVLGGGLSNIDALLREVADRMPASVFSDTFTTPIVRNRHGDSSGVRGAARLWP